MPNASMRLIIEDGISYIFDQEREKTLSISRVVFSGAVNSPTCSDQFFRAEDSMAQSVATFVAMKDGTITNLISSSRSPLNMEIHIGDGRQTFSLGLNSNQKTNIDFLKGDKIKLFAKGQVQYPRATLEIAWRL